MPARAIWKGAIKVGKTSIPVKLYSAVEDHGIHFHMLERRSLERIKQQMIDPETGDPVPNEEIRKGYELESGAFVLLTEEELKALDPEPSRDIEVSRFLRSGKLSHQWYERPYYLGPDEGASGSYFALAAALENHDREGLAAWVMRGRRYIGALRSLDGYLLLIKLRYSEEVLSAAQLPTPSGRALDPREVNMAEQLVKTLQDDFRPEDFREEYRDRVLEFIKQKAKGVKPKLVPIREKKPAASLVEVLAASLEAANAGSGKKPGAGKRKEKRVA